MRIWGEKMVFWSLVGFGLDYTGCPDRCGLRNGALTEMFLDFRGPQRLPWDPKDGRKLLLGKKHTFMRKMVSQDSGPKKEQIWIW